MVGALGPSSRTVFRRHLVLHAGDPVELDAECLEPTAIV